MSWKVNLFFDNWKMNTNVIEDLIICKLFNLLLQ